MFLTTTTVPFLLDSLIQDLYSSRSDAVKNSTLAANAWPPMNVWHEEHSIVLQLAVPGFKLKDLTIQVDGNLLLVKGKQDTKTSEDKYAVRQVPARWFDKQYRFPNDDYELSKTEAKLEDGILTITVPKKTPTPLQQIEIK